MRILRHTALTLAAAAMVTATAACGAASSANAPTSSNAKPAAATTTAAPSSTTTTTPVAGAVPPLTFTPGTDDAVTNAKPKVTVAASSKVGFSQAQQRAAAAWLNGFYHRSHLDFSSLPAVRTTKTWAGDMTPVRHAGFAKAAKAKSPTFGQTFSATEKDNIRAEAVPAYTMVAKHSYQDDSGRAGMTFLVHSMETFAIHPNGKEKGWDTDYKARLTTSVTVGVVPGPDPVHPWVMGSWFYEGGGSLWERQDATGAWVRWE